MYYSYHNKIKRLISEDKLVSAHWVFERFNTVYVKDSDLLVLKFSEGQDKAIRPHRQDKYLEILKKLKIEIK